LLTDQRFAVLDFETTGHAATRGGEVVETGAVRLDPGSPPRSFHALTRPLRSMSRAAVSVHGITDEMVRGRPRFADILGDLLDFLGDRIVVAHNARFDRSFLAAAVARAGRPELSNPFLDTVRLSRALCPELHRHDLDSLCIHHRIRREARHRALPDARATAALLGILLPQAEEAGIDTRAKLLAAAGCVPGSPDGPGEITLAPAEQERLETALVTGDRVRVDYRTPTGGLRDAVVVPYLIDRARGLPRLVAFDLDRDRTRTFRLDRLVRVRCPVPLTRPPPLP
jgi:DNA polymerase III epsilon subunit family exonuclease